MGVCVWWEIHSVLVRPQELKLCSLPQSLKMASDFSLSLLSHSRHLQKQRPKKGITEAKEVK